LTVKLYVNDQEHQIERLDGSLLTWLRRNPGLLGTRNGCGEGHCGSCTVLVNGKARRACITKMAQLDGARIETIEGLAREGRLHPLQAAFIKEGAIQCGFCTPGMIMAAKGLLDTNLDPTDGEIREALRHNLCRCTGYTSIFRAVRLAAAWLNDPSGQPQIPGPEAETSAVIGVSVPKVDAYAKVVGAPIFADDLQRDNMLYGKLVHGNMPYAKITGVHIDRAQDLPGVAAVLTAKDVPGLNAFGGIVPHQPVLAGDVVRYVGDPVAVVLAETEAIADKAARLVEVDLEPLEPVFTPEDALRPDAPQLHRAPPGRGNVVNHVTVKKGDVGLGFEQADVIVEGTYRTQMVEHAYLEPESALAEIDGDGRIVVYTGSQSSHAFRLQIARSLGVPEDRVRVIFTATGGAFGGKEEPVVQIHAALGAMKTGRPVKMTLTRRESIMKTTKRHAQKIYMKHGATSDGHLVAIEARILADTGPYASWGMPVVFRGAVCAAGPYVVPHVYSDAVGAYTNNAIGGAFRGFGSTQVCFAGEVQIDRLAGKLGIDPLEFRRRNALAVGKTTSTGQVLEPSVAYDETLVAIRDALAKTEIPKSEGHRKIGVGVASAFKNVGIGDGKPDGAGATVELTAQGRIVVYTGATDMGQGSDTTLAQIAAAAGGWPLGCVDILSSDTGLCPDAGMTTASRQTYVSGNAVGHCASALSERIRKALGGAWQADAGHIAFDRDGAALGERRMNYAELHRWLPGQGVEARISYRFDPPVCYPLPKCADHEPGVDLERYRVHFAYSFGTQAAIVEVDEQTGAVRVLKVIAAHEVGTAINPQGVQNQIEGCVVMGLGYGLMEEFRMSRGQVVTDTLKKLNLPSSSDVPEIEVHIVEDPQPGGPFGAKGLGELPVNPVAPAIINAIYDAVGVRMTELPVTPERLLKAIRERDGACFVI
jgi:CO/xanthine dehydrogenase Mo-binding subunit/aerobic-type carbon monoxide dehydrogenase small subunit (CoxS/CutS family)